MNETWGNATRHYTKPRTHSGKATAYVVEVRANGPCDIGGVLVGPEWKRIQTTMRRGGVPNPLHVPWAEHEGYMAYETALTVAAWFRCKAMRAGKYLVETRLVSVRLEWEHKATMHKVSPPVKVQLDGDSEWESLEERQ